MSLMGKVVLVGGIYAAYRNKNFCLAVYEETKQRYSERRVLTEAMNTGNAVFTRKLHNGDYDNWLLSDILKERLVLIQKHVDMIRGYKNSG